MSFNPGDKVRHKSDINSRGMVVVQQAKKELPPSNVHNELVNCGRVVDGYYYCTWIAGNKKGEGYFSEVELEYRLE